jgi:hypothetical protein
MLPSVFPVTMRRLYGVIFFHATASSVHSEEERGEGIPSTYYLFFAFVAAMSLSSEEICALR